MSDQLPEIFCRCALCHLPLHPNDLLADKYIYRGGELDYIELAHVACAEASDEHGWNC